MLMINTKEKANDVGIQKKGCGKTAAVVVHQMKMQPVVCNWKVMASFWPQCTYFLAAYQSTSNSNYSVTTSPTSPLHTTSAFFVWLKTFSDYVFQVNKKNVNGRQLKFLCVAICGDGPIPSFNQRLCAMLTFYGSTYQIFIYYPNYQVAYVLEQ